MRDAEAHGGAFEGVGGGGLVVAPRADVLTDDAEDLQTGLEGTGLLAVLVLPSKRRQQFERQVPLAGDDAVEPFANRVRVDVRDEARDVSAIALDRFPVLSPGDDARRKRRGKLRPDVHLVHVCLVSCDHALIPPLLVRPMCCLSASPIRRACPTAGHSTPCSQYQPWRRSKKTRCARAEPSAVSSTRNSRSTDVPSPHFCCALSSLTRK